VRPTAHTPASPAAKASPDKDDDVSLGKTYFRAGTFNLAERHFRRASNYTHAISNPGSV